MSVADDLGIYSMQLESFDQTAKKSTRTISGVRQSVLVDFVNADHSDSDTAVQPIDDYARALLAMTTNTFSDAILTSKYSVEEVLDSFQS